MEIYYNISNNIISNNENLNYCNYQIINNIEQFKNYNNIIINDIKEIINEDGDNKYQKIMDIYDKMNKKIISEENKDKKENNNIKQKINNNSIVLEKDLNKNNNYIIAKIKINDVNKDVRIINSFEEYMRENNMKINVEDDEYKNEKEIKDNCEIEMNNIKIKFSYFYKFKNEGIYKIKYIFKNKIRKINHLFSDCKNIEYIDFTNFNTQNIIKMNNLLYNCEKLENINFTNFNTSNIIDMSHIFEKCINLKEINI